MTSAPTSDQVNEFIDKLAALGGEILDAAKPALHVATEATLTAIQFRGISELAVGIVCLAAAPFAAWVAKRSAAMATKAARTRGDEMFSELGGFFGVIIFSIAAFVLAVGGVSTLLSADTWMALLRPDAYLAAKALGL